MTTPYQRDSFHQQQPTLLSRLLSSLPSSIAVQMYSLFNKQQSYNASTSTSQVSRSWRQAQRQWGFRRIVNLPHLFVLGWLILLLWGERWSFQEAIEDCKWAGWEHWPEEATPHHLILLADPQLVDPHTYPDRPWPLSTATMRHTDNYMKRTYISLQNRLHPDTIFFLGDLFDGGREWKTAHGNTEDPSWANGQRPSGEQAFVKVWGKRYGEDFWLKEYNRFGKIFYNYWNLGGEEPGPWQRGRRIISTLPGNHDLGFGANVKIPIRDRFQAYFGEGNRVDVIGNHTFVSIDSVSLSAGASPQDTTEITKPVEEFLSNVKKIKRRAVARELNFQAGNDRSMQYMHVVEDLDKAKFKKLPTLDPGADAVDLPTVLLTHVPLYRLPGTPCGPQREHWPPAIPPQGPNQPFIPDHRNAISISKGWQYQNVLSEVDSVKLISSIGNVRSVFSGDDHDYCELVHPENKNNAREITVKSMSWAMGVRKPGFLLVSMWNPIDASGNSIRGYQTPTTQTHLCLLPDQLGILARYGFFLAVTLIALIGRAVLTPSFKFVPFSAPLSSSDDSSSLLPTNSKDLKNSEDFEPHPSDHIANSSTSSTSSNNNNSSLAPRSSAARTRSVSPAKGYGLPSSQVRFATPPLVTNGGYYGEKWTKDDDDKRGGGSASNGTGKPDTVLKRIWKEAWMSVWRTTWMVLIVYIYLSKFG